MIIGICDDIREEAMKLKSVCEDLGETDIRVFSSSEQLLSSTELQHLDLLFLDIELKGDAKNGIEIKEILETRTPSVFIVFCTTHEEFMPKAFGKNVLFFLSKPFSTQSVKKCLVHASYLKKDFALIPVNNADSIMSKDILYLNFEQKYTIFYSIDGRSLLSRQSISDWAAVLKEQGFCRISRSTIINLKHYVRYIPDKYTILLHNNTQVAISRRYVTDFKKEFHAYQTEILNNGI